MGTIPVIGSGTCIWVSLSRCELSDGQGVVMNKSKIKITYKLKRITFLNLKTPNILDNTSFFSTLTNTPVCWKLKLNLLGNSSIGLYDDLVNLERCFNGVGLVVDPFQLFQSSTLRLDTDRQPFILLASHIDTSPRLTRIDTIDPTR